MKQLKTLIKLRAVKAAEDDVAAGNLQLYIKEDAQRNDHLNQENRAGWLLLLETTYLIKMSKLLDENSAPCTKSELDLFTVPSTQVAIRRSFWSEIQLQNPCTNEGPYEFKISPDMFMFDLSKNFIYFMIRIIKSDGSTCAITQGANAALQGDLVLPINLIGKPFFRQIKVYLNGKLISDSGDRYAYRSFLETELNFGSEAKKTHLQAAQYFPDVDIDGKNVNFGYKTRQDTFQDSAWVELMAPIHADLFMQDRFLINQCDLRIELYRNSDNFCILNNGTTTDSYKLEVKHMSLFVKKIEVADSIGMAIESMLQTTSAKYPIKRVQLTTMHITENRRSTPLNSLFSGILPRLIVVAMVEAEAARGSIKKNPFLFKDFGLSEIKITIGNVSVPSTPCKFAFSNNKLVRGFIQMFDGLNMATDDKGNMINLAQYRNGCTYFVFDLTSDGNDSNTWELIREGSTLLEILFDKDLPAGGIECIVYAEFDSLLMIDYNRATYMDYTI